MTAPPDSPGPEALQHLVHRLLLAELVDADTAPLRALLEAVAVDLAGTAAAAGAALRAERARLLRAPAAPAVGAWPSPLAFSLSLLAGTRSAASPSRPDDDFKRLLRLVDCFEVLVKLVGLVMLSDVVRGGPLPPELRGLLASTLGRPMLGQWARYVREAGAVLEAREGGPFVTEIVAYARSHVQAPAADHLLRLRNTLAHGSIPAEATVLPTLLTRLPDLLRLLDGARFLRLYPLVIATTRGAIEARGCAPVEVELEPGLPAGTVLLGRPDRSRWLELTPLAWMTEVDAETRDTALDVCRGLLIYSDVDSARQAVNLLNYALGLHHRERDLFPRFQQAYPLHEWRRLAPVACQATLDSLARSYVERPELSRAVEDWVCRCRAGFLWIHGAPGIGKSALLARAARRDTPYPEIDPPISQYGPVAVVPFFFRDLGREKTATGFLRRLVETLDSRFDLRCNRSAGDPAAELAGTLERLSARLPLTGERVFKVLILLDGLDEAVEAGGSDNLERLVAGMPKTMPEGVLMLLSSRSRHELRECFNHLDPAQRAELEVPPMSADETRALLYQVLPKYAVVDRPDYVEGVVSRSAGLPLFLHLLAEDLRAGLLPSFVIDAIPTQLAGQLDQTISRLERLAALDGRGTAADQIQAVLMAFAMALEPLTVGEVQRVTGLGRVETRRLVHHCLDILSTGEGRRDEDESSYRMFHALFADHVLSLEGTRQLRERIEEGFLLASWRGEKPRPGPAPDTVTSALLQGKPLSLAQVPDLARLVEACSERVTAFELLHRRLVARPPDEVEPLLIGLASQPGAGIEEMVERCLAAVLTKDGPGAVTVARRLLDLPPARPVESVEGTDHLRPARLALAVAAMAARQRPEADGAADIIHRACRTRDAGTAMLGQMALHRLGTIDLGQALEVVERLARDVLWWRIVRPGAVEPFAGAALGMLLEHTGRPEVTGRLRELVRGVLHRALGVRAALLLLPAIAERFVGRISDDYNPVNLLEYRQAKRLLQEEPRLRQVNQRLLDLVEPSWGAPDDFRAVVDELLERPFQARHACCLFPLASASISRTLAHGDGVLEHAWRFAEAHRGSRSYFSQSLLFDIRLVQLGRRSQGAPPLGDRWVGRAEDLLRSFVLESGARYDISRTYLGGYVACGLMFLAAETGEPRLAVLRDLVAAACTPAALASSPPEGRLAVILLRMIEVAGTEYGTVDPLGVEIALHGLGCFVEHADRLDPSLWERMASLLARLRTYFPERVAGFLERLDSPSAVARLRRGMQRLRPRESLGTILGMKVERLNAAAYAEPPGTTDGLRAYWQRYQRVLYSPLSLRRTMRELTLMVMELVG